MCVEVFANCSNELESVRNGLGGAVYASSQTG
jgi:hypothetical protein